MEMKWGTMKKMIDGEDMGNGLNMEKLKELQAINEKERKEKKVYCTRCGKQLHEYNSNVYSNEKGNYVMCGPCVEWCEFEDQKEVDHD